MSISTFYRRAVCLPLLAPLSLLILLLVVYLDSHPIGSPSFLSLSKDIEPDKGIYEMCMLLLCMAVPYTITLGIHYKILIGENTWAQRRLISTLPLRTIFVLLVCTVLCFLITPLTPEQKHWGILPVLLPVIFAMVYFYIAAATLVIGYVGVLITQFTLWYLQQDGRVEPFPPRYSLYHLDK